MKFNLTSEIIEKIEKRCSEFVAHKHVFEIHGASVDLIDGAFWTISIGWGNPNEPKEFHNKEIVFEDKHYSFDFLCGMIYQLIDDVEMNEGGAQ